MPGLPQSLLGENAAALAPARRNVDWDIGGRHACSPHAAADANGNLLARVSLRQGP